MPEEERVDEPPLYSLRVAVRVRTVPSDCTLPEEVPLLEERTLLLTPSPLVEEDERDDE